MKVVLWVQNLGQSFGSNVLKISLFILLSAVHHEVVTVIK